MSWQAYRIRKKSLEKLGFKDYRAYLASDLWRGIRSEVLEKRGGKCMVCRKKATEAHHLSYAILVLVGKNLEPVVPLCRKHHYLVEFDEFGNKRSPVAARKKYRALLKWRRRKS